MKGFLQRHISMFCALSIIVVGCDAQTAASKIDELQAAGLRVNPPGVAVHLATVGHQTEFSGKCIGLLLIFTSTKEHTYTVITNEHGYGDELVIARSDSPKIKRLTWPYGTLAGTPVGRRYIGSKPTEVRSAFCRELALAPGEYSAFVHTQRVAKGSGKSKDYLDDLDVTSDVVHFRVTPSVF